MFPTHAASDTYGALDALECTRSVVPALDAPKSGDGVRICHVSMTLKTGGLERLLVDFARHANRRRFQLRFVALAGAGPPADDLRDLGFDVRILDYPVQGRRGLLQGLKQLFREQQIDLVHTHNTFAHFYGTMAARRAGRLPVINTQHGRGCGDRWKQRFQFRIANRFAARVVGVSDDATRLCQGQDPHSAEKMLRIWNGIDVERFRYTGPMQSSTAITVARLSPEKDFSTLLRATAIVIQKIPEFRLRIVGDGSDRGALERLRHELGLEHVVSFLGERPDVSAQLSQSGFFISSSRTEGVSLTLLEAMSVGLPIVATAVGGTPEIVKDGVTGLLAPAGEPAALADAVLRLFRRKSEWIEMGRRGRERVEQQFPIGATLRHYEDLYEQVLRERQAG